MRKETLASVTTVYSWQMLTILGMTILLSASASENDEDFESWEMQAPRLPVEKSLCRKAGVHDTISVHVGSFFLAQ